uniref:Ig-like domain-containing protein n=1 Tax=Anas platyrhynchos platyrhynchos TaxID=8840 RepID=A0A493TKJ6_ANAPP
PNGKAPSVYVFPPPAEELARQETATLTCLASGFRPRDILVTWTQQDRPVASGSFSTFGPQEGEAGLFSVYSKLSVAAAEWQRGDVFACVVGHDGIPLNFVQKSLDKSTGKPTQVNVSVVLSDNGKNISLVGKKLSTVIKKDGNHAQKSSSAGVFVRCVHLLPVPFRKKG